MPRFDRRDVNVMTLLYLSFVNMLCFAAFAFDKAAARAGRRRVTERTLLLMVFAGGSGGALLASSVNAADGNIEKISMDERDGRISVVQLVVSVHDRVHLARVIKKLRALIGVIRITRMRA